jgi:hypothetical protein
MKKYKINPCSRCGSPGELKSDFGRKRSGCRTATVVCPKCGRAGETVDSCMGQAEKDAVNLWNPYNRLVATRAHGASREPCFDRDGYPTESTLDRIKEWDHGDSAGLIEYVGKAWSYPERWQVKGRTLRASTGGWSGNEELIGTMQQNFMFWSMCWESSRRGGHYVFRLPPKQKKQGEGKCKS